MTAKKQDIGTGDTAVFTTIKNMIRLARRDSQNKVIINIAAKIKNSVDRKTAKGTNLELVYAKACFDYVLNNIKYVFDHENVGKWVNIGSQDPKSIEFLIAPLYSFTTTKTGDCDCLSTALAALFLTDVFKIPCRFRIIAWKDNDFSHVYCEAGIRRTFKRAAWIPADVVIKEYGKEKAPVLRVESFRVD
jgi:hypothetical protein